MTARVRLISSLVALIGMLGPLCSLVCVDSARLAAPALAAAHSEPEPADCHGAEPASSQPPVSGERDCGCDQPQLALAPSLVEPVSSGAEPSHSLLASASLETPTPAIAAGPLPGPHPSLPPPDILLLTSALLL